MPKLITAGFASSDDRFRAAIDWREATRRRRPDLEDAILDRAYDALVDTLLIHPELGNSRRAVWALANQQLGWKINSTIRGRFLPDGNRRRTPAGAVSLNALQARAAEGGRNAEPAGHTDTAATALRRVSFRDLVSAATRKDSLTATIVVGYALGFGPNELAEQLGVRPNTVTQRKGRFERANREAVLG